MYAIAVNASPRKNFNTATLLGRALEGAKSVGAETEIVHLYDLSFHGCTSCFACKARSVKDPWRCHYNDGLTPVLEKVLNADVLFIGSPIYLFDVSSAARAFMERLIFPCISYDRAAASLFESKISSAYFFTMNMPEMQEGKNADVFIRNARMLNFLGGNTEHYCAFETYQFDDYSKYAADKLDEPKRAEIRKNRFPADCEAAFEIGARLCRELK